MKLKCSKCGKEKDVDQFHIRKNRPRGYTSQCKKCRISYPKKRSEGYTRNYDLKRMYGITSEIYDELLTRQNGKCKICQRHVSEVSNKHKKNLCVDHCHDTGKIRGLLCDKCNRAIGLLNDDVEMLKKAIIYLSSTNYT